MQFLEYFITVLVYFHVICMASRNILGFSDDELEYYSRQIVLRDFGLKGQMKLKGSSVCVVGVGDDIAGARKISLKGIEAITGGNLWSRTDIASEEHIKNSIKHVEKLRA